jgi:pimeloyl-ACP methyl ester carboxylesterase
MPATSGLFVDDLPSDAGDDAPLVVLVHGTMDRHSSFARLRSRLMATCHVVSYDRRGYAASRDAAPPATGLADHVSDLESVLAGRRATVVGHSYGGTVALGLAASRSDLVASVVAYEPPLAWLDWWPSPQGRRGAPFEGISGPDAADAFLRRIVGPDRYERLPLRTREEASLDGDALITELTAIRVDPAPFEASAITVPVLVVRGEGTDSHHVTGAEWLAAQLPAGSHHIVRGAGHGGHQSHPNEMTTLVAAAVRVAVDPGVERPPAEL